MLQSSLYFRGCNSTFDKVAQQKQKQCVCRFSADHILLICYSFICGFVVVELGAACRFWPLPGVPQADGAGEALRQPDLRQGQGPLDGRQDAQVHLEARAAGRGRHHGARGARGEQAGDGQQVHAHGDRLAHPGLRAGQGTRVQRRPHHVSFNRFCWFVCSSIL